MRRKKKREDPMPDALEVDGAIRAAEEATGERHIHAEPRDGFWEVLGDARDEQTRQQLFDDIQQRLGEKSVVNSIRLTEPKPGR